MRKIRNYEEFTNEEINLRKTLAGAAIGAGLALSNPVSSQNIPKDDKIESVVSNTLITEKKTSFDEIDTLSNENGFKISLSDDELSKAKDVKISYTFGYIQGLNRDEYPTQLQTGYMNYPTYDGGEETVFLYPDDKFYQAPAGILFGLHLNNFSIYFDCKWFGKKDDWNVTNWSEKTVLDQFTHTYEPYSGSFQNGTYTTYESWKEVRTGFCEQNNRLSNFSLGGKVDINKNYAFRGFMGVGVLNKTKLSYQEVQNWWSESTWWNLISEYDYDCDVNTKTTLIKKEQIYEFNLHGGLMIEGGGVCAGIGFDTNPGSFNISFGYTFGEK